MASQKRPWPAPSPSVETDRRCRADVSRVTGYSLAIGIEKADDPLGLLERLNSTRSAKSCQNNDNAN